MTDWIKLARDGYNEATDYFDNNLRPKIEDNIRHFQSRHHSASKYHKDSYQYRSKIFRPKTRSVVRGNEAAAVAAYFSNMDVVSIDPVDSDNPAQVISARINKELLQYRLTKSIPWFQIVMGGFQDAQVSGPVISFQEWKFKKVKLKEKVVDETGEEVEQENDVVVEDRPSIELFPVENVRFSPAANWLDPINTSPYLILMTPVYYCDVKQKMDSGVWKTYEEKEVLSASNYDLDTTTQMRNDDAEDQYDTRHEMAEFDTVWVHRNFIRKDGIDYHFLTIGTDLMLTDPEPTHKAFKHCSIGERPVCMGVGVIESHRAVSDSLVRLGFNLQTATNEVANQRHDNVLLVLNKRWKVRRGAQVDIKNLVRNVPGGAILMNEPTTDVVGEEFNDVTGSSYMEQDRLNVDFDELMGAFSASTIQTNRKLNETVGGMNMLQGASNSLVEYFIRTVTETWAEKVIRQLVKMEQAYETDETILAVAAQKSKAYQRFGVDKVTDWLLNQELTVNCNIGMGATNPQMKVERLLYAIVKLSEVAQAPVPGLKFQEAAKEVFAQIGYKDGARFVQYADDEDPIYKQLQSVIQQMQQEIANLTKKLEDKQGQIQAKIATTQMKEAGEDRRAQLEAQTDITIKRMDLAKEKMKADGNIMNSVVGNMMKPVGRPQ